jgi:MFS family permease
MPASRHRWYVTAVFFFFMLFHQADKLLLAPLVTPVMAEFQINEAQMGAVSSLAIIVAAALYPVWGYLYDRYARARLISLASLIWGATTWLSALAPTFGLFVVTRASTGIDDSSYPGLQSLISDYFEPELRGKVYGFLQMAGPLGFMLGTVLATVLGAAIGWRRVFMITGGIGILIAVLIFFSVREAPRGASEPEMGDKTLLGQPTINWPAVRGLLRNRTLLMIMAQGFFGVFPWNVLTFWFFRYLESERNYSAQKAMLTMIVAIAALSLGYFLGGYIGDLLFRRTRRGRILTGGVAVLVGALFLYLTMTTPIDQSGVFLVLLSLTGIAMSVASPNVIATVFDVTVPEVRSTAQALRKLLEDGGAAAAPFLAGLVAMQYSLQTAILVICLSTWLVCGLLFIALAYVVPQDIENLRLTMRARAATNPDPTLHSI